LIELNRLEGRQAGKSDGQAAIAAAQREGFPAGTVIFPIRKKAAAWLLEQKAIFAWVTR
jgi:hypothetical protein